MLRLEQLAIRSMAQGAVSSSSSRLSSKREWIISSYFFSIPRLSLLKSTSASHLFAAIESRQHLGNISVTQLHHQQHHKNENTIC
jgi:hypothetical protein